VIKKFIHAVNVRNVFRRGMHCVVTRIFTLADTSAQNVADVILERNRLNVVFVANDSHGLEV